MRKKRVRLRRLLRLRVLAISDWDIVTVMDLADKTEKEFEIGQLQRVRRIKQHEGQ